MEKSDIDYTLYLCTDRSCLGDRDFYETIRNAILGGCSVVQLREKNIETREYIKIAEKVRKMTRELSVPLIINDRVDVCMAVDADGVHLGQEDMEVSMARKLLGQNKIIGCSAHNLTEAKKAFEDGADYLGVGAIFLTSTKKNTVDTSIEALQEICGKIKLPVVAIGGIKEENVHLLAQTKISGIAVVSAIMAKEDSEMAAKKLRELVGELK